MEAFTLNAASGVKLKLPKVCYIWIYHQTSTLNPPKKVIWSEPAISTFFLLQGPIKQVAVNNVRLGWGPGRPKIRVTLTGVRLKLANPPIENNQEEATVLPPTDAENTSPVTSSNQSGDSTHSGREDSSSASLYLLNMVVFEMQDLLIIDEVRQI